MSDTRSVTSTSVADPDTDPGQQEPAASGDQPERVHVVRVAYEDRYPSGTDLHDAVFEDLRRYCAITGLGFHSAEVWFFSGMRWKSVPGTGYCLPTSVRGVRASVEATILPPAEAGHRRREQLTPPQPIPPSSGGRRHWNDAINGTTRRQRRRHRRWVDGVMRRPAIA